MADIDVALAIYQIDPAATYLLTDANAKSADDIVEWRGAGKKPTQSQLEVAYADYLASPEAQKPSLEAAVARLKALDKAGLDPTVADILTVLGA